MRVRLTVGELSINRLWIQIYKVLHMFPPNQSVTNTCSNLTQASSWMKKVLHRPFFSVVASFHS